MPTAKGKDSLEASFKHAEEALIKLNTSPSDDPKQLNLATSLIHDLEKKVMRLSDPDERDECRTKLEYLQQRLHDASGEGVTPEPSPASTHPGEVVGDIDDLFSGMQIGDAGDSTKQEFVPQAIPGRRYMKVVRTSAGGKGVAVPTAAPSPGTAGGAPARQQQLPQDAEDIAGQAPEKEQPKVVDSDEENGRYKPQRNIPTSPLRVLLPDMPLAEAAAGAGAASHGSADSTMARGGGDDNKNGGGASDSDDDSITSPDNYNEAASFKQ